MAENCRGVICGGLIKEGSITSDKFDKDSFVEESWFKDIICGLGCLGIPDVFDVIPTDITFEATGGTATVQVVVKDDADWEMSLN